MHALPHQYTVSVSAAPEGTLNTRADALPAMAVEPPPQFGGPGQEWSPETLLMASVSTCFVLSFRAVAGASGLEWNAIDCVTEGKLDKVDRSLLFTDILTRVELTVPAGVDIDTATQLLHKAERTCLVSNSLAHRPRLECRVQVAP